MVRFPPPLRPGDLIAITAPSSGVPAPLHARLDLVLDHLRQQGFRVVEGCCLRDEHADASAPRIDRAREWMHFLTDPSVAAIFPPWGGELATELLELIDFEALRQLPPKWFLGFSDLSTLHLPLTLISGWATVHGANLMDLAPTQTDALTTATLPLLTAGLVTPIHQASSDRYQTKWIDFAVQADAPLQLTEPTCWRRLDGRTEPVGFEGRLIGGCLDTIAWLAGTRFGDVPSFIRAAGQDGAILYLENCEMNPPGLVRALTALRRHGWFDGLAGLLLGRNAGPPARSPDHLSAAQALSAVLSDLPYPVLCDVDIGHQPPQFTLVNGATARVEFRDAAGSITQWRPVSDAESAPRGSH